MSGIVGFKSTRLRRAQFDSEYQAVARSTGGCTVYLTQNHESYKRVLGNDNAVDSLLGNLQAKIFRQNSGDTNEWAANFGRTLSEYHQSEHQAVSFKHGYRSTICCCEFALKL